MSEKYSTKPLHIITFPFRSDNPSFWGNSRILHKPTARLSQQQRENRIFCPHKPAQRCLRGPQHAGGRRCPPRAGRSSPAFPHGAPRPSAHQSTACPLGAGQPLRPPRGGAAVTERPLRSARRRPSRSAPRPAEAGARRRSERCRRRYRGAPGGPEASRGERRGGRAEFKRGADGVARRAAGSDRPEPDGRRGPGSGSGSAGFCLGPASPPFLPPSLRAARRGPVTKNRRHGEGGGGGGGGGGAALPHREPSPPPPPARPGPASPGEQRDGGTGGRRGGRGAERRGGRSARTGRGGRRGEPALPALGMARAGSDPDSGFRSAPETTRQRKPRRARSVPGGVVRRRRGERGRPSVAGRGGARTLTLTGGRRGGSRVRLGVREARSCRQPLPCRSALP